MRIHWHVLLLFTASAYAAPSVQSNRPADFVRLNSVDPSIAVQNMYFGEKNFLGRPVAGYLANACWTPKVTARALAASQARLQIEAKHARRRLTLLVKDCYRPQKAVNDFLSWTHAPEDNSTKPTYYPKLLRSELVRKEYISSTSGHSRGSSIDLTIAEIAEDNSLKELDFGTIVDFFGEEAHTAYPRLPEEARQNRRLLLKVMQPDFKNYTKEWWHFVLKREPYPKTAFDFDVTEE